MIDTVCTLPYRAKSLLFIIGVDGRISFNGIQSQKVFPHRPRIFSGKVQEGCPGASDKAVRYKIMNVKGGLCIIPAFVFLFQNCSTKETVRLSVCERKNFVYQLLFLEI